MPTTAPVRNAAGGSISHNGNALAGVTQSLTSVPAQSLLYAWVWLDVNTGDTAGTPAVTDNVGLTWENIGERSKRSDGGAAQNGHVSVFRATFTAGGSINVTASGSGGTLTSSSPVSLNVEVITGGRLSAGVPEIVVEASSTGTVKCPSGGTTLVGRYSYVRGSNNDWNAAATPTPAAGWTTRVSGQPSPANYTPWGADIASQAASQAVQLLSTAPTSGTINNSLLVEHLPPFTPLANSAEDGTNTVAPVAATSGAADNDPWDTVTATGNGVVTFSTDQAAHGTQSYKVVSGVTAGQAFLQWDVASIGRLDHAYGRFYLYQASNSADSTYMRLRGNGTQVVRITQDGSGHLQIRNSANTVVATFTNAITNSAWVRVEFDVTPSVAAGAVSVKLFNTTDSTTATETQSVTSQALGVAYVDEVSWGQVASVSNAPTMYLDDLQLNATGFPGPLGGGPADQGVTLTGLATVAAAGTPTVTTTTEVTLTGTASASAVGEPAVVPAAAEIVLESAPTLSAIGEPVVHGDDAGITLTGLASAAAVGEPAVVPAAVDVTLTGLASAAAVGEPAVGAGAATITLTGAASAAAVGEPAVGVGATSVSLTGLASAAAVGEPAVVPAAVDVTLAGLASAAAVGEPAVGVGAVTVVLTGTATGSAVGEPAVTVGLTVAATGVTSGSAVGQPAVTPGAATVVLTGAATASAVGQPAVSTGTTSVLLTGAASSSGIGVPAVTGGVPAVLLTGVASTGAFGLLTVVRETVDYGIRAAPHRVTMSVPGDVSTVT